MFGCYIGVLMLVPFRHWCVQNFSPGECRKELIGVKSPRYVSSPTYVDLVSRSLMIFTTDSAFPLL